VQFAIDFWIVLRDQQANAFATSALGIARYTYSRIITLHKSGKGYTEIARLLNNEGVLPRRAAKWRPNTIANITGARRLKGSRVAKLKNKT
jgi:hypothetical protein